MFSCCEEKFSKTLHFYPLAPVRREVLAIGKFGGCRRHGAYLCNEHDYDEPSDVCPGVVDDQLFLEGNGISYLLRYVTVTVLACIAYGESSPSLACGFVTP